MSTSRKNRFISLFFIVCLLATMFSGFAYAETLPEGETRSIPYTFVSGESTSGFLQGTVDYSDDWFRIPSCEMNPKLADLSLALCEASVSYFPDGDVTDFSQASKPVEEFLASLGFEDVAVNTFYNTEQLENTVGAVAGHKALTADGKNYTLLVLAPRSAGYLEEWAGNMLMGKGGLHEGFRQARDELLRFLKYYIESRGISGDIKIWVAGHSRGAGVANSVGGFLMCGNTGYLPSVSFQSEDVYCYTFGTPGTVMAAGLSKAELLRVSGARGGIYANDTPGEPFEYTAADKDTVVSPNAGPMAVVHNWVASYDMVASLPLTSWGYTRFGTMHPLTDGSAERKASMKSHLSQISPDTYARYVGGKDEEMVVPMRFDFISRSIVPKEDGSTLTLDAVLQDMLFGISTVAPSVQDYVDEGYETGMKALLAFHGIGRSGFAGGIAAQRTLMLKTGALLYLSHLASHLQKSNPSLSEEEALALAFNTFLEETLGISLQTVSITLDQYIGMLAEYIVNAVQYIPSPDGIEPPQAIFETEMARNIAKGIYLKVFGVAPETDEELTEAARMLYELATVALDAAQSLTDEQVQQFLYGVIYGVFGLEAPDLSDVSEHVGEDFFIFFTKKAVALLQKPENAPADWQPAATIAEAADDSLFRLVEGAVRSIQENQYPSGGSHDRLNAYLEELTGTISETRVLLCHLLMSGISSTSHYMDLIDQAVNAVTYFPSMQMSHHNIVYQAWIRAIPQTEVKGHVPGETVEENRVEPLPGVEGHYDLVQYCTVCGQEASRETISIPALPKITYYNAFGDGNRWTQGSLSSLEFVFKRSQEDEVTFQHFTGVQVDGVALSQNQYAARSGSAVIQLDATFLQTLSEGSHVLTAQFDDGDPAAAAFVVVARAPMRPIPNTSDGATEWLVVFLLSGAFLGFIGQKKRTEE